MEELVEEIQVGPPQLTTILESLQVEHNLPVEQIQDPIIMAEAVLNILEAQVLRNI